MDYSRQSQVFDQEKLKKGKVAIIGDGALANYVCAYLCGIGVGNIFLIPPNKSTNHSTNEFLCLLAKEDCEDKRLAIKKAMQKMNEDINIEDKFDMLSEADVVVELTNDPISKKKYKQACEEINKECGGNIKLFISASTGVLSGSIFTYKPPRKKSKIEELVCCSAPLYSWDLPSEEQIFMIPYENKLQGNFSSALIGALCVNEIRKVLSPLPWDIPLKGLNFHLLDNNRFYIGHYKKFDSQIADFSFLNSKKILVVGAGGTGTYTALTLALLGVGTIHIYDGDVVEDHNRNRQIFFYEKVGKPKASSLAERLCEINPNITIKGYDEFVTEDHKDMLRDYDVIFSCVDKWWPRKLLNEISLRYGIPLFDCGVTLTDGRLNYFIPGKNKDLNEVLGIDERIKKESKINRHCNPSVLVPNAIMGTLNVVEYLAFLWHSHVPFHFDKYLSYNDVACDEKRFYFAPVE